MPIRPVGCLVAVYLLATLPLVILGADGSWANAAFVAAHLAATLLMFAAGWREQRGVTRTVLDVAPLALVPWMYAELPILMRGAGSVYQDALIQGWESTMFGTSPARSLSTALPYGWLSEALHLAYFSYYALIYVPPLVLYARGERAAFLETTFALLGAFVTCFIVFVLFPVQGPRYLWTAPDVPGGPVRSLVLGVLEAGSSRGAAFPSSHVAVAVVQSVLVLRAGLRHGWVVAVLTAGLAAGAVYGGFHYGIDAVAGLVLGLVTAAVARAVHPWVLPSAVSANGDGQESPVPAS